jgi:hypothetical protein
MSLALLLFIAAYIYSLAEDYMAVSALALL